MGESRSGSGALQRLERGTHPAARYQRRAVGFILDGNGEPPGLLWTEIASRRVYPGALRENVGDAVRRSFRDRLRRGPAVAAIEP